jgi:predicted ATP-dependent serine protease
VRHGRGIARGLRQDYGLRARGLCARPRVRRWYAAKPMAGRCRADAGRPIPMFPNRSGFATPLFMAKAQKRYVCQACGSVSHRWAGQCGDCAEWNTLVEEAGATVTPFQAKHNLQGGGRTMTAGRAGCRDRAARAAGKRDRRTRPRAGGRVRRGSATLIGGDPGIGKSTLLLQAAARMAFAGLSVAYVSGEEAADQVRLRARRLGLGSAPVQLAAATSRPAIS